MKKTILCLLLALVTLLFSACNSESKKDEAEKEEAVKVTDTSTQEEDRFAKYLLSTIGIDSIEAEIGEPEGSRAYVVAQIPNYTELFLAVADAADPTEALKKEIEKKEYSTIEYSGYADVVYDDNGDIVIESEKLIKTFVEQELIKAINAAAEEADAQ